MNISKSLLQNLYHTKHLSQAQIGKELGLSCSRIGQLMRHHNIVRRDYAAASSNMNNQRTIFFNHHQEQLILGSMLGDANLHRWTMRSNKKSANILNGYKLTFAHSIKQIDYLLHKKEVMGGSKLGERLSGYGAIIKHFSFCHTPSLRPFAELCLDTNHRKRISEEWLAKIDRLGLAYWYMDDGSLIITRQRKGGLRPLIQFHTESFTSKEVMLLQEMLQNKFGLITVSRISNGDPTQLKLVSKHKREVGPFLEQLQDFIVPCMKYKIRWII